MQTMPVIVDGKTEQREVYSVVFAEGGRPVYTPVLADDEEMRATVCGLVHIFKRQRVGQFLERIEAFVGQNGLTVYEAQYSDGHTEQISQEQAIAWMTLHGKV